MKTLSTILTILTWTTKKNLQMQRKNQLGPVAPVRASWPTGTRPFTYMGKNEPVYKIYKFNNEQKNKNSINKLNRQIYTKINSGDQYGIRAPLLSMHSWKRFAKLTLGKALRREPWQKYSSGIEYIWSWYYRVWNTPMMIWKTKWRLIMDRRT